MSPRSPDVAGRRELALASAGLLVVAIVVYGGHIRAGAFISDDWLNAQLVRFAPRDGVLGAIAWQLEENVGYRPGLAVWLGTSFELLGLHYGRHLAAGVGLAVAACVGLYALARELGIGRLAAAAVAGLTLLFPYADSTRLWTTGSANNLAVLLWAAGSVVALRGACRGERGDLRRMAVGAVLVLGGVLVYEVVGPAGVATGALVGRRAGGRRGLLGGGLVSGAALAGLLYVGLATNRPAAPLAAQWDHARTIAEQAAQIAVESFGPLSPGPFTGLLLAVVAAVAWRFARPEARRQARQWAGLAAWAVPALALAYLMIVPAAPGFYNPLGAGQVNRVNLLAAPAYALAVVGVLAATATLATGWHVRWRPAAAALTLAALLAVGLGYAREVRDHAEGWRLGGELALDVVRDVTRATPKPAPGSTVFTFGHPIDAAPGVPVFSAVWDLDGALRLAWDDGSLHAYAALPGMTWNCGPGEARPAHPVYGQLRAVPYGRLVLVDAGGGTVTIVGDAEQCLAATGRYSAIPVPPARSRGA